MNPADQLKQKALSKIEREKTEAAEDRRCNPIDAEAREALKRFPQRKQPLL